MNPLSVTVLTVGRRRTLRPSSVTRTHSRDACFFFPLSFRTRKSNAQVLKFQAARVCPSHVHRHKGAVVLANVIVTQAAQVPFRGWRERLSFRAVAATCVSAKNLSVTLERARVRNRMDADNDRGRKNEIRWLLIHKFTRPKIPHEEIFEQAFSCDRKLYETTCRSVAARCQPADSFRVRVCR